MKERPILFAAPMVRALLDGSKTQTRRVCKLEVRAGMPEPEWRSLLQCCPYGQPGDRLWVRESWRIGAWNEDIGSVAIDYLASEPIKTPWITVPEDAENYHGGSVFEKYWTQSTDDAIRAGLIADNDDKFSWQPGQSPCRKRPSIHMPRWASRITLEVTGVRVERLQDICPDECIAEGVWPIEQRELGRGHEAVAAYRSLWEQINGPGSWDANPWVWVVEFKKVTP